MKYPLKLSIFFVLCSISISINGQAYNSGFPSITNIASDNAVIETNLTTGSYISTFVVLPASEPAPSINQVYKHTDANDIPIADGQFGDIVVLSANTTYTSNITNLTENSDYIAYVVSHFFESSPIETIRPTALPFTTLTSPPAIVAYNPLQNATAVPTHQDLILTFDENIAFNSSPSIYNIEIFIQGNPTPAFSYQISNGVSDSELSIFADQLIINPAIYLAPTTIYYVLIDADALVSSTSGIGFNGITQDTEWTFTTGLQTPYITAYDPLQDEIDVSVSHTLNLTFNGNIAFNPSLTRYYIEIYDTNDPLNPVYESQIRRGSANNGASITGNILSIDPPVNLVGNTTYYVLIDADGILSDPDAIGFPGITDENEWRFTTIPPIPSTTFDPLNGSTGISIQSTITVAYDQAVRNTDGSEITDLNVSNLITLETLGVPIGYNATISIDKTTITIVPDPELPADSPIDVIVDPIENFSSIEQVSAQTSSFETDVFNTWNGAVSSDYSDPANWDGVYANGFSVIIPYPCTNYPIITSNKVAANTFTMEAGTQLTINNGGRLTINDFIELKSSNTPTIGNACLLNNGTLRISNGAESRVLQEISNSSYNYYFSSPIEGATPDNIGYNGQVWERLTNGWNEISGSTVFNPAQGYVGWSTSGTTWTFSGTINNAVVYSLNAVRTTVPNNYGWNLAGNPYPCAIDWDIVSMTTTNLDNSYFIRITGTNQQGSYNGNTRIGTNLDSPNPSHIPPMQAFYTKVSLGQTNGTLIIPQESRALSNFTYLKSANSTGTPVIRIFGLNNELKDELAIAFLPDATDGVDDYDTEKMFASPSDGLLEVFTINNTNDLTIDTYSTYENGRIIPLGYKAENAGSYQLKLGAISNFTDNIQVTLEDLLNNEMINLNIGDTYEFETDKGTFRDRFNIHIAKEIPTNTSEELTYSINIYNNNQNIYIKLPNVAYPSYLLYDLSGRLVQQGLLTPNSLNSISSNITGAAIIKVVSTSMSYEQKLFLK